MWASILTQPIPERAERPQKGRGERDSVRMTEIASLGRHSGSPSDSPRYRDPDDPARGLVGFGISDTKALTTGFMERCLRALGLTVDQFNVWTGYRTLRGWTKTNLSHTQRSWYELVVENIDSIRGNE